MRATLQRLATVALVGLITLPAVAADQPRVRLRELGIHIGRFAPGPWNAITDVAGITVGHATVIKGHGKLIPGQGPVRTGVTAIIPRADVWRNKVFAGGFVLNGNGELTAMNWVREAGWLETPILLTNTLSVGRVADGLVSWMHQHYPEMGITDDVVLPMVGECDDSFLNDQRGRHNGEAEVFQALATAASGPVAEGAVGAGTGMVSYRFKGGIGTSSRKLPETEGGYTVGVLLNCNMGRRHELRIDGVPVGRELTDLMPVRPPSLGSAIVVVATDAPLLPFQLERLAKRAAIGLVRTGTSVHHGSGDFVIAFSTANVVPHGPAARTYPVTAMANTHLDALFEATQDATEEAVGNALTMATTTVGRDGHTIHALPLDRLLAIMRKYGRLTAQPQEAVR